MATMGKYCKAYLLEHFRAFDGWTEKTQNARVEKKEENGQEVDVSRELVNESILYLQENYVVTDGLYKDENIIFDNVTPEWIAFCEQNLQFEIPEYALFSQPEDDV